MVSAPHVSKTLHFSRKKHKRRCFSQPWSPRMQKPKVIAGFKNLAASRWRWDVNGMSTMHFHQWQTCLKNPPDTSLQGGPPENEIVGGIACINHMIIIYWHENLMGLMMLWWSHDGTQTELLPFSVNSPQLPTSNHYKADRQRKELIPSEGWVQSKLKQKVPTSFMLPWLSWGWPLKFTRRWPSFKFMAMFVDRDFITNPDPWACRSYCIRGFHRK